MTLRSFREVFCDATRDSFNRVRTTTDYSWPPSIIFAGIASGTKTLPTK